MWVSQLNETQFVINKSYFLVLSRNFQFDQLLLFHNRLITVTFYLPGKRVSEVGGRDLFEALLDLSL